jgi:hypothetical protein
MSIEIQTNAAKDVRWSATRKSICSGGENRHIVYPPQDRRRVQIYTVACYANYADLRSFVFARL